MTSKQRPRMESHSAVGANLEALLTSAEQDNRQAQHDLAAFYATDDVSSLKDEAAAFRWYKRAAECGHAESQYDLGFMLLLGEGAEKDVAEGMRWLERAGEGGSAAAALLLTDIYSRGMFGVAINQERATFWAEKSDTAEGRI